MFRQIAFQVSFSYLRASLLCLMLGWACAAHGKPAAPSFGGVVAIADGEPFTLVRCVNSLWLILSVRLQYSR